MRMARIMIFGLLLLAGLSPSVFGGTTTAAAPVLAAPLPVRVESQRLRWKGKTIKIAVSTSLTRFSPNIKSDSDVLGAVRRSLDAWAKAADLDLQFEVSEKQNVSPNGPAGDGVSLITIAATAENILFFGKDTESASAKTRIFFNRRGVITEADIVLNPFQQFSTDGTFGTFDLESTLTHEIGHLLGLHHSGVLGATMAESFAKNGTMGVIDFGPRTLAASDIGAIRELYGAPAEDLNCCSSISGRLLISAGRPAKGLQVWAEQIGSGRVMGQSDTAADGTFRIGGLPAGDYFVYWKTKDVTPGSSMGEFRNIRLEVGEDKTINETISVRSSGVELQYLGLNGQLADYGISLAGGRSYIVNLGGKNIDPASLHISFGSEFIRISQLPTVQEFGEGVSGISFGITVDPQIAAGQYSIFVSDEKGAGSSLIGALSIN
jgi:hypothetical protein